MRFFVSFILIPALFSTFFSCSLNYLNSESSEADVPEFIFTNASFSKYENGKRTTLLTASTIEQYKDNGSTFAGDAAFKTFSKDEELETEGKCSLIFADTEKEKYTLFGNIDVNMLEQKTRILAENLKFDKKSEQITSSVNGSVSVIKDDLSISGKGFSASMISKSFYFSDSVSGKFISEENQGD